MNDDLGTGTGSANGVTSITDPVDLSDAPDTRHALWRGDTGVLRSEGRRALLKLIQGPYLSQARSPKQWSALLSDEATLRSRLHDIFLDLVIDREAGFAFVRNANAAGFDSPTAVRSETLTFIDTAMLLVLRQMLLSAEHDGRVIVGQEEVYEQLEAYRSEDRDQTDFTKRLNSSWAKLKNRLRVIHTASEDRVEISPVLRLLIDAEQVRAIHAEYDSVSSGDGPSPGHSQELEDQQVAEKLEDPVDAKEEAPNGA